MIDDQINIDPGELVFSVEPWRVGIVVSVDGEASLENSRVADGCWSRYGVVWSSPSGFTKCCLCQLLTPSRLGVETMCGDHHDSG